MLNFIFYYINHGVKTGSTSIQVSSRRSQEALLTQGIRYFIDYDRQVQLLSLGLRRRALPPLKADYPSVAAAEAARRETWKNLARKRHQSRASVGSVPRPDIRLRHPIKEGGGGRGPIRRIGEDLGHLAPVRFVQVSENLVDQFRDPRVQRPVAEQPPQRVRDTAPFTQL